MTLHHHHMASHRQQVSHLQKIIHQATTHPNRYYAYQLNLIHTQVHQIILRWTHMTHRNPVITNKDNLCIRNVGWGGITVNLLKIAPRSQPSYLRLHTIPKSQSSNWMRITYSSGYISSLSLIPFLKMDQNLRKLVLSLWTIHTKERRMYHIILNRPQGNFHAHK